ncbi:MAG: hypothetical protein AAGH48_01810 [Pseudomonadota bacterium]
MRTVQKGFAVVLALVTLLIGEVFAAEESDSDGRVLIIYDSSNSMWGELSDGARKYEAGRAALAAALEGGLAGRRLGFRAYGHRRKDDCRDSELMAPFADAETARETIDAAAASLRPKGMTPITLSLQEGLKDLDGGPGDILLISDGIETCDADPCALMREWTDAGVHVRVHVVGVGLNSAERAAMACIAGEAGGRYFDADTADGFKAALNEIGDVIEQAPPPSVRYALVLQARDAAGHAYLDVGGRLLQGGETVSERVVSEGRGRMLLEGPGDFEIEVGARLADGSIFEPTRLAVTVSEPGDTLVEALIAAPARVTATFSGDADAHGGALVRAYQGSAEIFRFRASDEALAVPGLYEFRTAPNSENQLTERVALTAGETTQLHFEMVRTVKTLVRFQLPDGEILSRGGELWLDGEKRYNLHRANPRDVRPGTYELRSPDLLLPLAPTSIDIAVADGEPHTVPIAAGWVTVRYAPSEYGYVSEPDRAFMGPADGNRTSYVRLDEPIPVAPGDYIVKAWDRAGFIKPATVAVSDGASVDVLLTPKPLGELVVTYAPSDAYDATPDRAFVRPLDGQIILGSSTFQPGEVRRLLPGRYRVEGWSRIGDVEPTEIEITAETRSEVTLRPTTN